MIRGHSVQLESYNHGLFSKIWDGIFRNNNLWTVLKIMEIMAAMVDSQNMLWNISKIVEYKVNQTIPMYRELKIVQNKEDSSNLQGQFNKY